MFTEGLEPHAVRWVREGHVARTAASMQRQQRIDPLRGMPPPEKYRSGHLPVRRRPVHSDDGAGSCSDMDESSDTEESAVYGSGVAVGAVRNGRIAPSPVSYGNYKQYYSSDACSEFSSSRDAGVKRNEQLRNMARVNGDTEDDENGEEEDVDSCSYSGRSTEISSRLNGSNDEARRNLGDSAWRNSAVDCHGSRLRMENDGNCWKGRANGAMQKQLHPDGYSHDMLLRNEVGVSDIPSAPELHDCQQEISEAAIPVPLTPPANMGTNLPDGATVRKESFGAEVKSLSSTAPARVPTFHASAQGPWYSTVAYDACVRLCLHAWARGCSEAPIFLDNECLLLRNAFGLQYILLQSEEELLARRSPEQASHGATLKAKKIIGKMKVQVRKVRMSPDMPSGCNLLSFRIPRIKLDSVRYRISNAQSNLSSGWASLCKVQTMPHVPANSSFTTHSLAYMHASAQYMKQVSLLLKTGVTTLRNNSLYESVQETFSCQLRLKSSEDGDWVPMQPGSGETHVFFPDSLGDGLIVDIYDSKGKLCGRCIAQAASVADDLGDKVRWWPIYHEPKHVLVGRLQLYTRYTTNTDDNNSLKCGPVAETVAYDIVLESAMKAQIFQQRNLSLQGYWKWLLSEFASYYGVSDAYTKLRYLSYVMDVATPTSDCLTLVHELLLPVIMKSRSENALSHQENRILGEIEEQIEQILAMVFENYKALDESLPSGVIDGFKPPSGMPAPVLEPAIKLYGLLHDILCPDAQLKLCRYFQAAARKRCRRYLLETDEYVSCAADVNLMDVVTFSAAYQKMLSLCRNLRNEIFTDIEIHNKHILPSSVDLPNLAASIYSVELCNRLRSFLVASPPSGPSSPVAELVIATADFQQDLASWKICPIKGGVDAKELFHLYIMVWIQDKRLELLEACKLDKVKWSSVQTQHMTTQFVDDMYGRLNDVLVEYEVITCRWPEYTFVLENAIADVEKAIVCALEKQYADVLVPIKECLTPKRFGLKYVQKLAKRNSVSPYAVPDELAILLNTLKRLLDVLRPRIEAHLKTRGSCIPDSGNTVSGERHGEFTVTLRTKYRNCMQALVEKLAENTRLQNATKIKKIIQDSKDVVMESDIRTRMQPLKDLLINAVNHLHSIFEAQVFVALCRGFWDRIGQDILSFLGSRKENRTWYRSARISVTVLNETFASQMQQLLGNMLLSKDLEAPRSITEVRSILGKDLPCQRDSSNFHY